MKSEPGAGSEFSIDLPLVEHEPQDSASLADNERRVSRASIEHAEDRVVG